jgi:HD-like signal output (HDOD) protein
VSRLVESDMALAAAVLKAVNSSLYGLRGRVQSVQQAMTYLGLREVTAITFEMGLRAAFPPAAELEPLWDRAARRGLIMGRLAHSLDLDAWAAHSAGLFEECGKAVLFRHAKDHYRSMLRAAPDDAALVELERVGFGVSHDALGAALCESWGLAAVAVSSVRHHVAVQAGGPLPPAADKRAMAALSAIAHAVLQHPERLEDTTLRMAELATLDLIRLQRSLQRLRDQLEAVA